MGMSPAPDAASSARWRAARRILCVRLDSLGDVLMCTPAMRVLRQAAPGRRLTLLSSAAGVAAAPYIPELDAAIAFAAPWMKHAAPAGASGSHENEPSPAATASLIADLQRLAFDAAVIFTSCTQSALPAAMLCHQAGIPLRLASCRENPYALLTDWIGEPERERATRHEVQRQLDLVAAVGCETRDRRDTRLSFSVSDHAVASLDALLEAAGIDGDKPLLVLHPGASAPSRRYPARHWPDLLRGLRARNCQLVLTGDAGEAPAIDAIIATAGVPARSLAGCLTLPELGALLQRARLLVANNTGPAHLAAAVGTPVVSLYAMTNPQHTPWQVAQHVLFHPVDCRDCLRSVCPQGHHACLERLAPATVVAAASALLADSQHRTAPHVDGGSTGLAYESGPDRPQAARRDGHSAFAAAGSGATGLHAADPVASGFDSAAPDSAALDSAALDSAYPDSAYADSADPDAASPGPSGINAPPPPPPSARRAPAAPHPTPPTDPASP